MPSKANRAGRHLFAQGGEERLIRRIELSAWSESAQRLLAVGIGDDAALYKPRSGRELILTCDWFLEGKHFLRETHSPDAVGWKCLARAVSDVAAMGGQPRCFLLSLALPPALTEEWLKGFLGGLRRAARRFRCVLAGGDTTRSKSILINVMVAGEVARGQVVLRSGARPGDMVFVSGYLGAAEAGLQLLRRRKRVVGKQESPVRRHFYPEPRLALGCWLAESRLATAMMDLSDGLSTDLMRLCAASGVGARIEAARLPAVDASNKLLPRGTESLKLALHGGDDYELLFTVSRRAALRIPATHRDLALTCIGEITEGRKVLLIDAKGAASALRPGGWDPFARQ